MKTEITDIQKVNISDDIIITVKRTPGWFGRLVGHVPSITKYRGHCTIWHEYPSGERQSTQMEWWLCNAWQKWKWECETLRP